MPRKIGNYVESYAEEGGISENKNTKKGQKTQAPPPTPTPAPAPDKDFKLRVDPKNYRLHPARNKELIAKSSSECGAGRSIVVDKTGASIAGSGVLEQAEKLGIKKRIVETEGDELVVVVRKDLSPDDPRRKALALADNATSDQSTWDYEVMREDWTDEQLQEWDIIVPDISLGGSGDGSAARAKLADRFVLPPFSVLDAACGPWQERKRAWKSLIGISGTMGESREDVLGMGSIVKSDKYKNLDTLNTVSIFDPVLAELIAHWFLPGDNCAVCDPFAGGIFGYVAGFLGHSFTGMEIRAEQAELNNKMVAEFPKVKYICDDGQNIAKYVQPNSADMVFSCPPYFDLEHYSNLPNDASNQKNYADFLRILDNGLTGALSALKDDRFAVVVMSNVRGGKKGGYYDICSDITKIMERNGLILYNEIIYKQAISSAPVRAGRMMDFRKVVRLHQEVLVYFKGDPKNIKNAFPQVEVADLEEGGDE